jgi:phage gpG-like protein
VIEFRITVQGEQRLRQALNRLATSIQDYSPAWKPITQIFRDAMRGQFATGGARGGKKWAPLSRAYSRWKERVAPGRPILVLTGDLVLSLTSRTGDTIQNEQPLSLALGTTLPYAKYHQNGTRRMPARPPLVLLQKDADQMARDMVAISQEYGSDAGFRVLRRRLYRRG